MMGQLVRLAFVATVLSVLNFVLIGGSQTPSVTEEVQMLFQNPEQFLSCVKSHPKRRATQKDEVYLNSLVDILMPYSESPITNLQARMFQTLLATFVVRMVEYEMSTNDHIRMISTVFGTLVDCILDSTGVVDSKLAINVESVVRLLIEQNDSAADINRNSEDADLQNYLNLIEVFVNTFSNEVYSNPGLFDAYDTSMEPSKAAGLYYDAVFGAVQNFPNAEEVARTVSEAVGSTFHKLTKAQHVLVYANKLARYLLKSRVLTSTNLSSLCQGLVHDTEEAVNSIPDSYSDNREGYIQAIINGLVNFLGPMDLFTEEGASYLADDFSFLVHYFTGIPFSTDLMSQSSASAAASAASYSQTGSVRTQKGPSLNDQQHGNEQVPMHKGEGHNQNGEEHGNNLGQMRSNQSNNLKENKVGNKQGNQSTRNNQGQIWASKSDYVKEQERENEKQQVGKGEHEQVNKQGRMPAHESSQSEKSHRSKCSTLVDCFAERYIDLVGSSRSLSAIFDTSLSPQVAEAQYYRVVYLAVNTTRSHGPDKVSRVVSDAIADTWRNLTKSQHLKTQAYTLGLFLDTVGGLTPRDVDYLADSAVYYVQKAVRALPRVKDPRLAYIQAASMSLVDFFRSLNLYKSYTVLYMAEDFAEFLYSFTGVNKGKHLSTAGSSRATPSSSASWGTSSSSSASAAASSSQSTSRDRAYYRLAQSADNSGRNQNTGANRSDHNRLSSSLNQSGPTGMTSDPNAMTTESHPSMPSEGSAIKSQASDTSSISTKSLSTPSEGVAIKSQASDTSSVSTESPSSTPSEGVAIKSQASDTSSISTESPSSTPSEGVAIKSQASDTSSISTKSPSSTPSEGSTIKSKASETSSTSTESPLSTPSEGSAIKSQANRLGKQNANSRHTATETSSPTIEKFATEFTNAVMSRQALFRIYDTSLDPYRAELQYYDVVYRAVEKIVQCSGKSLECSEEGGSGDGTSHEPGSVALTVSNAIKDTFGFLTPKLHALTYGAAAATYMTSMDKLTADNVDERIRQFTRFVDKAAKSVPDVEDKRLAYIQAASDGVGDFLMYLGIFTPRGVPFFAEDFTHFLYLFTGVPQTIAHPISKAAASDTSAMSSVSASASSSASSSSSAYYNASSSASSSSSSSNRSQRRGSGNSGSGYADPSDQSQGAVIPNQTGLTDSSQEGSSGSSPDNSMPMDSSNSNGEGSENNSQDGSMNSDSFQDGPMDSSQADQSTAGDDSGAMTTLSTYVMPTEDSMSSTNMDKTLQTSSNNDESAMVDDLSSVTTESPNGSTLSDQ